MSYGKSYRDTKNRKNDGTMSRSTYPTFFPLTAAITHFPDLSRRRLAASTSSGSCSSSRQRFRLERSNAFPPCIPTTHDRRSLCTAALYWKASEQPSIFELPNEGRSLQHNRFGAVRC